MRTTFRDIFRVDRWQLDYLFTLGAKSWLVHVGVVSLTFVILLPSFRGETWPFRWFGVILTLSLLMAGLALLYGRRAHGDPAFASRAGHLHTTLTALIGLTWGAGAFGAATGSFRVLLIYSLVLGGTALGAVSSQHAVPRSALTSLWTSIPMLAAAHLYSQQSLFGAADATMIVLFAVILSILTVRMHQFLRSNVDLNRRLDEKISELTAASRELDMARREAERANLSKSRFLAQASHDLKQPVHAISLFTACLRDSPLSDQSRQIVDNIDRSLRSVADLFRSLLDISALDVGKIVPRNEVVALDDVIDEIVRQFQPALQGEGSKLRAVRTSAAVRTDPALLQTMIQNLVSNAVKYAPGRSILVGVRRHSDGRLKIEVHDQGDGIADEHQDRIFDEFYRVDAPGHRQQEGLGLGLSIVVRMAQLMDLTVLIRSYPGRGTRASIEGLEIAVSDRAKRRSAPTLPSHPLKGRHILLVDNDEAVLLATRTLLERWGCTVTERRSIPEEPVDCDLIVTDLDLDDGASGKDCIKAVRGMTGRDIPAVVITGMDDDGVQGRLGDPAVPVVNKPVRPAELRSILTAQIMMSDASAPA